MKYIGKLWVGLIWSALLLTVGCTSSQVEQPTEPETLFKSISSSQSGITFNNKVVEKYENFFEFFMYVYNGGGVSVGDVNNDGLADIYFTGNEIPNKLYLNKGNLQFEDITVKAGVTGDKNWTNGVSMIDINSDGWLDIYVCKGGWHDTAEARKNQLFINQGDLTFKEEAAQYGLADTGYSMQATFFDLDNDNDLDIYLINRPDSFALPLAKTAARRMVPTKGVDQYADNRDKLYINQEGHFVEEGLKRGIGNNYGYGLSVVAADINEDGFADLFVSNDFSVGDYFYINQKDGTFKQQIKTAMNHTSLYSMGIDITDMNNDGQEDIVVMEMRPSDYIRSKISMPQMSTEDFHSIVSHDMHKQFMHNMFFLNQGNTYFSEVAQYAGISKTDWSWSVLSSDLDNDGFRDLFITNGMRRDLFDGDVKLRMAQFVKENRHRFKSATEVFDKGFQGIINSYQPIKINNYLFRNEGELKFEDVSKEWGFNTASFSNGAVVVDLDNDGDLDLVVNNLEDEAFLFENTVSKLNNYIQLDLQGPAQNKNGIGAKVILVSGGKRQYFENKSVRGYLSSSDQKVHFGIGKANLIDSIIVRWNDGKMTVKTNIPANQLVPVLYSEASGGTPAKTKSSQWFAQNSTVMPKPFVHHENTFNEYKEQVLLPHMLSKNGPFMSKGDINGDGLEDMFVGGASGQAGQLYIQSQRQLVAKSISIFVQDKKFEDAGSAFLDIDGDGDLDLIVASGGSEFEEGSEWYRSRIYYNDGKGNLTKRDFLPTESSASVVTACDFDQDGDMDIFIGGEVVANRYLIAPYSYLFVNEAGKMVDRTMDLAPDLSRIGMVRSARWVDLDADGQQELVLAGEWMPISVLAWTNGQLVNKSSEWGLDQTEGWWNTIEAADLDGDGDMDLVLGNQGENYKFQASAQKPFEVYASDFDGNGTHDIFLAKKDHAKLVPIRGKQCTSQQMPVIGQKFQTYASFAYADLNQIIGQDISDAIHKEAYLFSSVILENKQGKLVVKKLPKEAQFSTVLGIVVEDFDGDGILDLLIAGNKFDVEIETTAADSSPGYLLKGKGNLVFETITPAASGFFVPYNVKDIKSVKVGNQSHILVSINDGAMMQFSIQK